MRQVRDGKELWCFSRDLSGFAGRVRHRKLARHRKCNNKEEPMTKKELSFIWRKLWRHEDNKTWKLGEIRKGKWNGQRRRNRMSNMEMIFLILVLLLGGKFTQMNSFVPLSLFLYLKVWCLCCFLRWMCFFLLFFFGEGPVAPPDSQLDVVFELIP